MGETGAKSVGLGTFFGFISSSGSFTTLATAKALFKKGADFILDLPRKVGPFGGSAETAFGAPASCRLVR